MDGYVHLDSNFVNQRYKPLYPDRTLDKKIDKLCERVDRLVNVNAMHILVPPDPPKPPKIPFKYLAGAILLGLWLYLRNPQKGYSSLQPQQPPLLRPPAPMTSPGF